MRTLFLTLAVGLTACGDKDDGNDTSQSIDAYCFDMADADTFEIIEGGPEGASGVLEGFLITDETDDLRDPAIVVNVDYTIENLDTGGSPKQGKTGSDGSFNETLGAGTWLLRLSDSKGGFTCRNEIEFQIEAERVTRMCLDVGCE